MKKILSLVFFGLFLLSVILEAATGNLFAEAGSIFATYGIFIGKIIGWLVMLGSSVFFFFMDRNEGMSFYRGYRQRGLFCILCIVLAVFYMLMFAISCFTTTMTLPPFAALVPTILAYLTAAAFPFAAFVIFTFTASYNVIPFFSAKRVLEGTTPQELLSPEKVRRLAPGSAIWVNSHAIVFKKLYCVIPIARLAEVKKKELRIGSFVLESNIVFKMHSGKKVTIVSKEYDALAEFLNIQ